MYNNCAHEALLGVKPHVMSQPPACVLSGEVCCISERIRLGGCGGGGTEDGLGERITKAITVEISRYIRTFSAVYLLRHRGVNIIVR